MKYRLLLVDDEALELDALKNYVDWEAMGLELAGTARNGKTAWEKILTEEPDIVITDIQMPVMDGITLAKKIFNLNRQIKILFLTGYDDIEYLKAAIKVSAVDYIQKPFSDEAIKAAVEKACIEIEQNQLMQHSVREGRNALIKRICVAEAEPEVRQEWLEKLAQLNAFEQEGEYYGMMQIYGVPNGNLALSLENKLSEIISVWQEGRKLTVVIKGYVNTGDSARRMLHLLEQLTDLSYNGVFYERRIMGRELPEVFQILESYEEYMFYSETGALRSVAAEEVHSQWEQKDSDMESMNSFQKRLTESIMSGNQSAVAENTDRLFDVLLEHRASRGAVMKCLDKLIYEIEGMCAIERNREEMGHLMHQTMEQVEHCLNMGQIQETVMGYFRAMTAYNAADVPDTTDYVVQKVKEYIHRNYARQITSADLAGEIHLSQNYIRSIFKEGTGKTILEYLTEYRFERATELLRMPWAKVKEVSVAVGYENVPYFCTLFTRNYGMTPGEYHKKYKS